LPATVTLAGEECPLDYAIEDGESLVRVRVPEKLLARIAEDEVPVLDRPLHWTVLRGKREAVRAATLAEAREVAARPRVELRREGKLSREDPAQQGRGAGSRTRRGGAGTGPE